MSQSIRKVGRILVAGAIGAMLTVNAAAPVLANTPQAYFDSLSQTNGYEDYSVRRQGKCGYQNGTNVTYTFYDNGLLVLSGSGKMDYFAKDDTEPERYVYSFAPWDYGQQKWKNEIKVVRIENGITNIGAAAFKGCENLTRVEIPASVSEIGDSAFDHCKNLKSVALPPQLTRIGAGAFNCSGLESVSIPGTVSSIGDDAFNYCKLNQMSIENGVQSIGKNAFHLNTGLTSVMIPASVTTIGQNAFGDCSNLTSIQIDANNPNYTVIANSIYTKNGQELLMGDPAAVGIYTVPAGTVRIGKWAFESLELEGIILPEGLNSIGAYAFAGSAGLKAVYIPASVTSMGGNIVSSYGNYTNTMPFIIYAGSEAQWNGINDGLPPTLSNVEMVYNGVPEHVSEVIQTYNNAGTKRETAIDEDAQLKQNLDELESTLGELASYLDISKWIPADM